MIPRDQVTGVILCGGDARRMHGAEKPLQLVEGKSMVQHVRERLAPQVSRIIISANREHDRYHELAPLDLLIADAQPGLGPLGGIATALPIAGTSYVFCCPGDAPFLHDTIVERLAGPMVANASLELSVPADGKRVQNLFLLLRTSAIDRLQRYLAVGGRSVHGFIDSCNHAVVDASDIRDTFLNVNTSEELETANQLARKHPIHSSLSALEKS